MADVLQEYLISLGYKLDQGSFSRFQDWVGTSKKGILELGGAVAGAAFAVGELVEHTTREYQSLYYMSQRTRESVAGLKAFEFAARSIGLSTQESQAAVENFTTAMRLNPMAKGFAQQIGGRGSPVEQMLNLVEWYKRRFGEKGYFAAAGQLQQIFGIDEQTINRLWYNTKEARQGLSDYNDMLARAGLDTKSFAQASVEYQRAVNKLEASWSILTTTVGVRWVGAAQGAIEWMTSLTRKVTELDAKTKPPDGGPEQGRGTQGSIFGEGGVGLAEAGGLTAFLLTKWGQGTLGFLARMGLRLGTGSLGMLLGSTVPANAGEPEYYPLDPVTGLRGQPTGKSATEIETWAAYDKRGFNDRLVPVLEGLEALLKPEGAGVNRFGFGPSINQETHINVLAGPDPWSTAQAVYGAQDDVNRSFIRYNSLQFRQ